MLAVGERHVLKLFPPIWLKERAHESAALRFLAGRLPVVVPEVAAEGELDGWEYVLMTRLPGRPLDEVWDDVDGAQARDLAAQVGQLLAALRGLDATAAPSCLDWSSFLTGQLAAFSERQQELGLADGWAACLLEALRDLDLPARAPRAFLHTEVMPAHLSVVEQEGRLRLAGLLDLEPAMVGDPDYELASCSPFFFRRRPELFEELAAGHGGLEPGWRDRALAYTCLHRYANVPRYLEWMPVKGEASFSSLRRCWFGA